MVYHGSEWLRVVHAYTASPRQARWLLGMVVCFFPHTTHDFAVLPVFGTHYKKTPEMGSCTYFANALLHIVTYCTCDTVRYILQKYRDTCLLH